VVLPDPEGPNNMVNPGAALNSTSRENTRSLEGNTLRMLAVNVESAGFGSTDAGMNVGLT
jgi:hypothetical protein